ncbi:mannitol dehydrogenase [Arenicella chitinivorans]|uniref:Mannitol dehydrogenase n=1 Tax=Arenicella chitinivorans TaxID=1329800 RepID=A0A918VHY8_9GAMM|nr:mannitol dehydrogenase family protein [Arenicella chitinivorans]GGZ97577.1 mannitol dehydrogenase [Arenicella chitinivorans]
MKLTNQALADLPTGVQGPQYDHTARDIGIVHLGIGAFHRCHMAVYTDDVMAQKSGDWRILGVSLRSQTISDQLNPQDGLYSVVIKDSSSSTTRVIGSVAGVLFAPQNPQAVIQAIAKPSTQVVSLTVTEKGYCHDPATGELNQSHPDIQHDLADLAHPVSAIGYLAAGLQARRDADAGAITILSCDNLPANGQTVEKIVTKFAGLVDVNLVEWIGQNVSFPSSMVDRIVPAMEAADKLAFAQRTGLDDAAVLQTEPFTQWVIEDSFAGERPSWERAGATMVSDVAPYEDAKLRMLNGSHSALAYLGYLAGFNYVHQVMAEPVFRQYVDDFMRQEAATSLHLPTGMDIDAYRRELQDRYDNSALQHRTYQIAMDGSQKVPQRLLGTLRYHLANEGPISATCIAIAAWLRYLKGEDERGQPYEVQDPMADRFTAIFDEVTGDPSALVDALLQVQAVFGQDLIINARFTQELTYWFTQILENGVSETLSLYSTQQNEANKHINRVNA